MLKIILLTLCALLSACSIFHDDYADKTDSKQDLYIDECGL